MEEIVNYLKDNNIIGNIDYEKLNSIIFDLTNKRYSLVDYNHLDISLDFIKNKEIHNLYLIVVKHGYKSNLRNSIIFKLDNCPGVACYIGDYPDDLLVDEVEVLYYDDIRLNGRDTNGNEVSIDAKEAFAGQLSYLIESINYQIQSARRETETEQNC